jgi:hypothetical protein
VTLDRNDLEDGMTVKLSEIQGIPSLNGKEFKVARVCACVQSRTHS